MQLLRTFMLAPPAANAVFYCVSILGIIKILRPRIFAQTVNIMICIKLKNPWYIYSCRTWLAISAACAVKFVEFPKLLFSLGNLLPFFLRRLMAEPHNLYILFEHIDIFHS